jgi:hypothetical protein
MKEVKHMSISVKLHTPSAQERPFTKPLDEAVWQAWLAKGRAREQRGSAARVKAATWASIGGLLATAGLWSHLTPYEVIIRFIVAGTAMVVMFQAFHARHYAVAAVFGGLALIYNPILPAFSFSGDWQRTLVVASTVPFVASLAWRNARTEQDD